MVLQAQLPRIQLIIRIITVIASAPTQNTITNSLKQWYCKCSYPEYNYNIYPNNVFMKALYQK
jgi:hypothetical protein